MKRTAVSVIALLLSLVTLLSVLPLPALAAQNGTPNAPVGAGSVLADGEPAREPVQNGPGEDGFFYLDGVRQKAYQLIEFEGGWYFIDDGHKYACNKRIYLSQRFVEGTPFPVGWYDFGDDGRMVLKNGPWEDGFFYLDGVRQKAYQLIGFEGGWYFIDDGHKYARNKRIYLSQRFIEGTPFPVGWYDFGDDGRMIVKNGPWEDGFFYLDGVRQKAYQLIGFEGGWYFIDDGHKYARNKRIYLSQRFVEGTPFPKGYYDFGDDGRMVVRNGPWEDGFFYLDGVRQNAYQLIKFEGSYYFINDGHKYARNKRIYLSASYIGEEPLEVGYYEFGDDGTLQNLIYYYNEQGELEPDLGLILRDGYYYYVRTTGQLAVGRFKIRDDKVNEFLKGDRYFDFDEQGRMMPPAFYIVGIRNARDVGLIDEMKTADGRDVKSGLLLRGTELDGAINPFPLPAELQAYGVDLLLNRYQVRTDLDLRNLQEVAASATGLTDPLGPGVTHNYYNCPVYTNIFTESGKARVKAIFDALCDPDSYPVYLHCTYGLDRTGVICFLVEAALGVDEASCVAEYCLSRGSYQPSIDSVRSGLWDYAGSSFTECVERYLNACGVSGEQIETLRGILLED